MNNTNLLIKMFQSNATEICKEFVKKQGFDYDDCYWIGSVGTGIFCIIDQYYFDMDNIIFDLENNIKAGVATKWIDAVVEYECNNINKERKHAMNYASWCKGVRFTKKFGY
jgi:hypothetical protein